MLERLTHPSSAKGSAFEGYRRLQWDEACRAVTSLEVELPVNAIVTLAASDDTDPGDEGGGTSTPSSGHSSSTPTGQTGARLSNHDSNHDTKRKPLEIPGVLEWRRRESNPGPEALKQDIYVCSHQYLTFEVEARPTTGDLKPEPLDFAATPERSLPLARVLTTLALLRPLRKGRDA